LLGRTFRYFVSAQLPCAFAGPAGWGDIVIAVVAPAIVGAMRMEFAKTLMLIWNTIGLIDIIFVVFSALRFGLKDWQSMHALRELPLVFSRHFWCRLLSHHTF
jgi:hypothetical protein